MLLLPFLLVALAEEPAEDQANWRRTARGELAAAHDAALDDLPSSVRFRDWIYTTVVDVVVSADGTVVEASVDQPSGVPEMDEALIAAIRRLGKLTGPPDAAVDEHGRAGLEDLAFQITLGWIAPDPPPEANDRAG